MHGWKGIGRSGWMEGVREEWVDGFLEEMGMGMGKGERRKRCCEELGGGRENRKGTLFRRVEMQQKCLHETKVEASKADRNHAA